MGEGMLMKRGILTLDFWKDTITYQKRIMPTGSLACAALNISDDTIENLITISRKLESFGKMLALGTKIDNAMLTSSKNTAVRVLEALRTLPPFDLLDMDFYLAEMERVFSRTGIKEFKAYIEALVRTASKDELLNNYCTGQALVAYMHELEQLGRACRFSKHPWRHLFQGWMKIIQTVHPTAWQCCLQRSSRPKCPCRKKTNGPPMPMSPCSMSACSMRE